MRKATQIVVILGLISMMGCWFHKHAKPQPTPATSSDWRKVDSHGIFYRYRRNEDIGRGNFAWTIEFKYDGFDFITFAYSIETKKGDGAGDTIEGSAKISVGAPFRQRVGPAASLGKVTLSDVKTSAH